MPQPRRPLQPNRSAVDWFGAEIRYWRELRGLTPKQLGDLVGLSADAVEKIEKGDRLLSAEHAGKMDQELRTGGVLARFRPFAKAEADKRRIEADRRRIVSPSPRPRGKLDGKQPTREVTLEAHAFAASPPEGGWDDPQQVFSQVRALTGATIMGAAEIVDSSIIALVESYEARGPQALAPEARSLRVLSHQLLADRGLGANDRRDLLHLAGRISALLAYMAVNAGAPLLTSQAYAVEAAALANEIGDTNLAVWVAGTRSLALYYAGSYAQADAIAAAGIARSPDSAQSIRLLVNGRARALGRLHNRYGAEKAIQQALDLAAQHELPSGLTSCIALDEPYSHARLLANAVTARLSLGDAGQVNQLASQIEGLVDSSDSAWSRALVRLDQATACLVGKSPDVDRAMELGRQALRAGEATPIRSVLQRAQELHQAAAPWSTHSAVRDYAAALTTWRSSPAAGLLTT